MELVRDFGVESEDFERELAKDFEMGLMSEFETESAKEFELESVREFGSSRHKSLNRSWKRM
jgi:hypothetical protein